MQAPRFIYFLGLGLCVRSRVRHCVMLYPNRIQPLSGRGFFSILMQICPFPIFSGSGTFTCLRDADMCSRILISVPSKNRLPKYPLTLTAGHMFTWCWINLFGNTHRNPGANIQ